MGNTQTKKEEDKSPEKDGKEEENEEDKEEQRKASVVIIPWSNEERNQRFSELKVRKDEELVSTVFNVKIQEIEQKKNEDSESATERTLNDETESTPVRSVRFQYNSRGLEETACIHSVVDSTDDEKTLDYITLSLEVEIAKNLVIYTFHQYNGVQWTKTEIEQKVGRSSVDVDVYGAFTTKTIFFSMRYMREEIIVPSRGFEYKSEFSTHQRITFPKGAVQGKTKITVNTLSLEVECKRNRLKENMDAEQTKISSLSDIVYVHHSKPFKKEVTLRLKLDRLFPDDISHETFLYYCDDDGNLKELTGVKVTIVEEEEAEGDQIYEVKGENISGVGAARGEPGKDHTRTLMNTFGLGPDYCRILVFLLQYEDHIMHLWSDIISEKKYKEREEELKCQNDMIYLKRTVSPTVPIINLSRLRITVSKNGRVKPAPEVPVNGMFMYYDRNAAETYNHFPIMKDMGIKCEAGIIQYEIDTSPKRLLHTAYFNSELYMDQRPKNAKRQGKEPQRPGCQKNSLPDLRSQRPGSKRNPMPDLR